MKNKYNYTYDDYAYVRRPYVAPCILTTPSLLQATPLLAGSEELRTTIKEGPASEDGRSNEMNFDEDELSVPPSLWND
jgi:hypothetical protein